MNNILSLLNPLLDKLVKVCLYNSCKNNAKLILIAQKAIKTDENYHIKTENAVSINVTLIQKLQSTNIIDGNRLLDCLSTLLVLASMKVVQKSSRFYLNFDWSGCKWQPLN